MEPLPSLTVIIPTFGRARLLAETLAALAAQDRSDFYVVVVVDGPDEATELLLEETRAPFDLRWVILPDRRGPAAARNTGAKLASTEILLFLDDDMIADQSFITAHRRFHESKRGERWLLMGNLRELHLAPAPSFVEVRLRQERYSVAHSPEIAAQRAAEERSRLLLYCGNNCSLSADTYSRSGGADEELRGREDYELGGRLYESGVQFAFDPTPRTVHHNTRSHEHELDGLFRRRAREDMYRVLAKHQRMPQTQPVLEALFGGWKSSAAWHAPGLVKAIARLSHHGANRWNSELMFHIWKSTRARSAYAEEMRLNEASRTSWRRMVGEAVAVLSFHSVATPTNREEEIHGISPKFFRRIVRTLARSKGGVAPLARIDAPAESRRAILTFDDGYEDFFCNAFPVLQEFSLPSTVFVVAGLIGKSNQWDEQLGHRRRPLLQISHLRELHRHGVEIGSHSMTHADLTKLSATELVRQVADSKKLLEDALGAPVRAFAYPYGLVNEAAKAAVAEAGYEIALGTAQKLSHWDDRFHISRINIGERDWHLDVCLKIQRGHSPLQRLRASARSQVSEAAQGIRRRLTFPASQNQR